VGRRGRPRPDPAVGARTAPQQLPARARRRRRAAGRAATSTPPSRSSTSATSAPASAPAPTRPSRSRGCGSTSTSTAARTARPAPSPTRAPPPSSPGGRAADPARLQRLRRPGVVAAREPWRFASRDEQQHAALMSAQWHALHRAEADRAAGPGPHARPRPPAAPARHRQRQGRRRAPVCVLADAGPRYTRDELAELRRRRRRAGRARRGDIATGGALPDVVARDPRVDHERLEALPFNSPEFARSWTARARRALEPVRVRPVDRDARRPGRLETTRRSPTSSRTTAAMTVGPRRHEGAAPRLPAPHVAKARDTGQRAAAPPSASHSSSGATRGSSSSTAPARHRQDDLPRAPGARRRRQARRRAVAAVSLTRTAAAEIAGRDTAIPDENVGTLHAHCYRALDRPKLAETPEGIRAWNEAHPAPRPQPTGTDQLEDAPVESTPAAPPRDELHAQVMTLRARMAPPAVDSPAARLPRRLDRLQAAHRAPRLHRPHRALPRRRRRCTPPPRVLLLDEAQDFSRLELALAVAGARTPRRPSSSPTPTSRSTRGAAPTPPRSPAPARRRRVLEQSYRVPAPCTPRRRWLAQLGDRRSGAAYQPTDRRRRAVRTPRDAAPPRAAARRARGRPRRAARRACCSPAAATCSPRLAVLRDRGIPFHNPYRAKAGAWNPLRAANRLLAFLRPSQRAWGDAGRAWTWDDLRLWTEPLSRARRARPRRQGADRGQVRARPLRREPGRPAARPRRRRDLLGATDSIEHPALRGDVDWWDACCAPTSAEVRLPARRAARARRRRAARAPEADHRHDPQRQGRRGRLVYVFPDLSRAGAYDGWHRGGPGRDQIVRMFYVALTRARAR
jgi:hypothetical protein